MITVEHIRPRKGDKYTLLFDDYSYNLYLRYTWRLNSCDKRMYLIRHGEKNTTVLFHRQLLGLDKMDGMVVDHIDGNSLNNQIENLRLCSISDNNRNKVNKTPTKGYYFNKERNLWQSQLKINGKTVCLGKFNTEQEAADVYKLKCLEMGFLVANTERHEEMSINKKNCTKKETP